MLGSSKDTNRRYGLFRVLKNMTKQSIIYDIGCITGSFDDSVRHTRELSKNLNVSLVT